MAATINVEVGVNDNDFRAFAQKFDAYRAALDKTPDAWKNVAVSSQIALAYTQGTAVALTHQADEIGRMAGAVANTRRESEAVARHWRGLQQSTAGVARNIAGATEALLKWSGVGAVIAGITGGIAALGMSSFGGSIASSRSAALGVGASYGGRSSFLVNFGRMTDAEGFLGRVNEVQHRADNIPLTALGLSKEEAQGDTADVGANAILKLKKLVDGVKDPRFLAETLHANRADELVSLNQAQILRGMSPEEVQKLVSGYRRDKGRLGLSNDAQRKWQEFSTGMTAAEKKIENTFVRRLGALTPGLTKLASSFSTLIDRVMTKDGPISHWLEKLNDGVEWLAKNIDTPEFQTKVEKFISGVGELAQGAASLLTGVLSLAKWLGITPAAAAEGPSGGGAHGMIGLRAAANARGGSPAADGGAGAGSGAGSAGGGAVTRGGGNVSPEVEAYIRKSAAAHGIDPDIAVRVAMSEGLRGFDPAKGTWSTGSNDAGTSWGPFQNHYASNIPGFRAAGLGDAYTKATGQRADDIKNWKSVIDFDLDHAKHRGWGEWHGWRGAPRAGLDYRPANATTRVVINRPAGADQNVAAAAAANP